ncbi:uncharacterized protein LOC119660609 isoform X2 [Hermetia illucens]|uniref:uncharacterized protein LOC119660609 isoform X2 n=1 Tax=Hermetia illucens TaxID=343691 RepID=UPI0018CC08CD|nr:uncharacterized protein LOC119660609 isoform X2 [Hermetia illucens]
MLTLREIQHLQECYLINAEDIKFVGDPNLVIVNITLRNNTHSDVDLQIKRKVLTVFMRMVITLVQGFNRKSVIFDKRFNMCESSKNPISHFLSIYLSNIARRFFRNGRLCPLGPASFRERNIPFNTNLLPLQIIYRPGYSVIINSTFSEDSKLATIAGYLYTQVKIVKTVC